MAPHVTYADLDRLLVGKGFVRRSLPDRHVAYLDQAEEPVFVFPDLPLDQSVRPVHLATVRRWLIELGLNEPDEMERWLCQFGVGDRGRTPVAATIANGR